jgi:hypothetical protein
MWQSELGRQPPDTWNFGFRSIDEPDDNAKAEIAQRDADTLKLLHDAGIITTTIALKELKQNSIMTGRFTNITDKDIKDSEEAPAPWDPEAQQQGMPGMLGAQGQGKPSPFGGGGGGQPGGMRPPSGGTPPQPTLRSVGGKE